MSLREQMGGDTVAFRRLIVSVTTATYTASDLQSGTLFLFNKVDGITLTLPASASVGTFFDVLIETTLTSVAYKIITAVGTELLVGQITGSDTDTGNATIAWPALVGSSYIAVSMDKTTTGGIKGDRVSFTKINATTWLCEGHINNNGTVATPFSAS